MSREATYRIVYADGIISTPLSWVRTLYDVKAINGWGVASLRPVKVLPGDAPIDMVEMRRFLCGVRHGVRS